MMDGRRLKPRAGIMCPVRNDKRRSKTSAYFLDEDKHVTRISLDAVDIAHLLDVRPEPL